jgi:hypothetical protein
VDLNPDFLAGVGTNPDQNFKMSLDPDTAF